MDENEIRQIDRVVFRMLKEAIESTKQITTETQITNTNRNKVIKDVIKWLELCEIGSSNRCFETECPYYEQECTESLKNDILTLLKEQEAEIERLNRFVNGLKRLGR